MYTYNPTPSQCTTRISPVSLMIDIFLFVSNVETKHQLVVLCFKKCITTTTAHTAVYVSSPVLSELERIITESEILKFVTLDVFSCMCPGQCIRFIMPYNNLREDDKKWPEPDRVGRQELEIYVGKTHISFTVRHILDVHSIFCWCRCMFVCVCACVCGGVCGGVGGQRIGSISIQLMRVCHTCTVRQNWFIIEHQGQ